jgi:Scramblase
MASLLAQTSDQDNSLLAPVHIPEDPNAVLKSDHPARNLLAESGIVVQRQIEMMNIFLGFEQANRYVILDPHGNHLGYMAEHDGGIAKTMGRQWFRTHRSFTTHIFDRQSKEVLRFHRPFSWINSTIRVYDPIEQSGLVPTSSSTGLTKATDVDPMHQISPLPLDAMRIVGEAQSQWAPLRRKYNLFLAHDPSLSITTPSPLYTHQAADVSSARDSAPIMTQFAYIDERFLSWDFSLLGADSRLLGSVNRSFRGFGREIFTDTGAYVLRMDAAGLEQEAENRHIVSQTHQGEKAYAEAVGGRDDKFGMTLDQRALMLATAVTVDFDYFSRHSRGGGMMPFMFMGGGGEAAGGAAAGGAAEAGAAGAGAVVGGAGRAVGGAAGAAGAGEGAIAGAGTMAGYEAMQRGMGRDQAPVDDASPHSDPSYDQPYDSQSPQSGDPEGDSGDSWGSGNDPWAGEGSGGGGDGDGEGGGILQWLWDLFFGN